MNRLIGVGILIVVGLFGVGLFVTWVAARRADRDRAYCTNNLRQLAQFAALHADPPKGADPASIPNEVPVGTVPNPEFAPDRRLAWTVPGLLTFDQKVQDTAAVLRTIDPAVAWDADANRQAGTTRVTTLICVANPPPTTAGGYWPTQYVGTSGVGPDAAKLGLGPPVPPDAGGWRYDEPTPFAAIADGLSSTTLFAETNHQLGPWPAGGPSTLRGLDVGPAAIPVVGAGGQFGGNHVGGGNFAFADGSVRWLSDETSPGVVRSLVTISGSESDPITGE